MIGRRGDYATTRKNVRRLTRIDDAEADNSRLTLLLRLKKDVRIMGEEKDDEDDEGIPIDLGLCSGGGGGGGQCSGRLRRNKQRRIASKIMPIDGYSWSRN